MICVSAAPASCAAVEWLCDIVFTRWFKLDYRVEPTQGSVIELSWDGHTLRQPDLFIGQAMLEAPNPARCPARIDQWQPAQHGLAGALCAAQLPLLFGHARTLRDGNTLTLDVDLFGTLFFLLSRYEELARPQQDAHGRFAAAHSLAVRGDYLERPLADEYAEVLWSALCSLSPALQRAPLHGQIAVSCDVDEPFDFRFSSTAQTLKALARSALHQRSQLPALLRQWRDLRRGCYQDPCDTFDWYLDQCESHGHRAAFYFIADHSAGKLDGYYSVFDRRISQLMQRLARRGHELGMHGSYNNFASAHQVQHERKRLQHALQRAGVDSKVSGNRQHYLRWDSGQTPDHLEAAGFAYDTSGGFADRPGFRYGTARTFPMWSWRQRRPLQLLQKPLIVMECSVTDARYLGLGHSVDAYALIDRLKERSLRYGGDFNLLWHNTRLQSLADKELFLHAIKKRPEIPAK